MTIAEIYRALEAYNNKLTMERNMQIENTYLASTLIRITIMQALGDKEIEYPTLDSLLIKNKNETKIKQKEKELTEEELKEKSVEEGKILAAKFLQFAHAINKQGIG